MRDWESFVGGNLLNKLGVFILVIGIGLALGYSFTQLGPAGRVAVSLAASGAMIGTGVALEGRYGVFARGLLGGGWAALYLTTYAMHAVAAARVIENPYVAAALLLAVAAGMIGHSLRYRSETVTGLAYCIAFVTLAIAEPNGFAVPALLPLAGSLLYVARRFEWRRFALIGAIGTYGTIALRGNPEPAVLAVSWLLFEAFDILVGAEAVLPLNAAGFLGLSILAWQVRAPEDLWRLAAGSAAAYFVSAVLRARSDKWPISAAISAALAAAAIFLRGEAQWTAFLLLVEAEAVYLAGVKLRAPFLRHLGTSVFAMALAQIVAVHGPHWVPVAALGAAMFYANSFVDRFHGYAGAALLALVVGHEAPQHRGIAWTLLASATFAAGWWWRRPDLRVQGYGLATLGVCAEVNPSWLVAAFAYAGALCGRFSRRLGEREAEILRFAGSLATTGLLVLVSWQAAPVGWKGIAWIVTAGILLELGVRGLPKELCRFAVALACIGAAVMVIEKGPHAAPPIAAAIALFAIWRAPETAAAAYPLAAVAVLRSCDPHAPVLVTAAVIAILHVARRTWTSFAGSGLLAVLLFHHVSGSLLTVAWGAEGIALLIAGFLLRDRILRLSGLYLLLFCILKAFAYDLRNLETLPRIFSFIVLGLILVGVSWLYVRYRDASRPPTVPERSAE
jgi:hypothetical protein